MPATVDQPPTTTTGATFLVATDCGDDPASAVTRELGLQLAREAGARVVLYDHSAESSFIDPFEAAAWASGQIPTWEQLLSPQQLHHLGYGYLAEQLSYAEAMGLDAAAWLPFGLGPPAMGRCSAAWGVTKVILPAKVANPSVWARLRGANAGRLPGQPARGRDPARPPRRPRATDHLTATRTSADAHGRAGLNGLRDQLRPLKARPAHLHLDPAGEPLAWPLTKPSRPSR